MPYILRNAFTRENLAACPTLTAARQFCDQRLLRQSEDRTTFLSDLAAGLIRVYDAAATCPYRGPGF